MRPRDLLLILAVDVVWGFSLIAGKYGVTHFEPLFFIFLRFALVLVVLLPWLRWVPGRMNIVFGIAFVMGVVHFSFQFVGTDMADNLSSVAVLNQASVPLAVVLAVLLLGERVTWRRAMGLLLSFLGIVVMSFDPAVFRQLNAVAVILFAQMMYATTLILMRRLGPVSPLITQAWMAAVATPCLGFLSWFLEDGQAAALADAGMLPWGAVVYNAIAVSVFGHSGVYYLVQRYPVSLVTALTLLAPVMSFGFALWVWGDALTWRLAVGAVMTLVGVTIISLTGRRRGADA